MSVAVIIMAFLAIFVMSAHRADKMTLGQTHLRVWAQFAALPLGAVTSVWLSVRATDWSALPMMSAVIVFLVLGRKRWQQHAPEDITQPTPLDTLVGGVATYMRGGK